MLGLGNCGNCGGEEKVALYNRRGKMIEEHQGPTPEEWEALKREADARDWELQAQIARLQEEAEEARFQAKLAEAGEYDEVAREKLKLARVQEKLARVEGQQEQFQQLIQAQYYIADVAGINPGDLDPREGWDGMMKRAFAKKRAAQPAVPSPQAPPQAPPPSPSSGGQEDIMSLDPAERWKRIAKLKGKGFSDFMESLGEKK